MCFERYVLQKVGVLFMPYLNTKRIAIYTSENIPERFFFGVTKETLTRTYRVLSFDGGGVRGIMQAIWLYELSKRLDKPVSSYFDLIAGTSVGSILACAVAANLDMKEIIQLFLTRSGEIFPGFLGMLANKIRRIPSQRIGSPLYNGIGLERELKNLFGDRKFTFADLEKPVLITTYSTTTSSPSFLRSDQPRYSENHLWEICRASCAVPAFFPAFPLKVGPQTHVMIDGGIFGSNPTDSALIEAIKINEFEPRRYVVASFGTGASSKSIPDKVSLRGGPLEWLFYIIGMLFNSLSDSTNYKVQKVIGDNHLFRFQVDLPKGTERLYDASPKNMQLLKETAEDYLRSTNGNVLLNRLVEELTSLK